MRCRCLGSATNEGPNTADAFSGSRHFEVQEIANQRLHGWKGSCPRCEDAQLPFAFAIKCPLVRSIFSVFQQQPRYHLNHKFGNIMCSMRLPWGWSSIKFRLFFGDTSSSINPSPSQHCCQPPLETFLDGHADADSHMHSMSHRVVASVR